MLLYPGEHTFCFVGRFQGLTQAQARERIEALGGRTQERLTDDVDVIVVGSGDTHPRARALGLFVLSHEQFEKLLHNGVIDATPPGGADDPLDALLGDLRSVFDGPYSQEKWARLTDQIDRCAPHHVEALVSYAVHASCRWSGHGPDFCLAPEHWVHELAAGDSSPKYQLLRGLETHHGLRSPEVVRILENPDLKGLTYLDLTKGKSLTGRAIRQMLQGAMASVRELVLGQAPDAVGNAFLTSDSDLRIKTLRWLDFWHIPNARMVAFFTAPVFSELDTLEVKLDAIGAMLDLLAKPGHLDRLDHLVLHSSFGWRRGNWGFENLAALPLSRLTLRSDPYYLSTLASMMSNGVSQELRVLDLSAPMRANENVTSAHLIEALQASSSAFHRLERLHVGVRPSTSLERALEEIKGLEVTWDAVT